MKSTHDLTERALSSLLRLLSRCSPETQPEPQVLDALDRLLERHRGGTPAADVEARLTALQSQVEGLKNNASLAGLLTKRKA